MHACMHAYAIRDSHVLVAISPCMDPCTSTLVGNITCDNKHRDTVAV